MKKIVFNGEALANDKVFGINRYEYEILKRLDRNEELFRKFSIELVYPQNQKCELKFENIRLVPIHKKKKGFLHKVIWQQIFLPYYVKKNRAIGVDMTLAMPVWGFHIISMHDCICEEYRENYQSLKEKLTRFYHYSRTKIITKKKLRILTLSQFSKDEIIKFYGEKTEDKIDIVCCGWEHMSKIMCDDSIFESLSYIDEGRYFFSLGSKYKHKNFQWVVDAALDHPNLQFVVTGSNQYSSYFKELEKDCPSNLFFTGFVSDESVKALMTNCLAVIQPSLYEGFGLPPLEALSLGKPILISNSSCFPEIYGESAHYISEKYISKDLLAMLDEPVSSADIILDRYNWELATEQFIRVLDKV